MKRRLFLQIWGAFLGLTLVWLLVTGISARAFFGARDQGFADHIQGTFAVLADDLPPPEAPAGEQAAALQALADRTKLGLSLFDPAGRPIAATGSSPEAPNPARGPAYWTHQGGPGLMAQLPDGRWLGAAPPPEEHHPSFAKFLAILALIAAVMAAGCWPLARRITRRVEALRRGVDAWGEGALHTRVPVQGHDEIADLARRFNASADRVQALVDGQRRMLASASHELRSPLARLRMTIALLEDDGPDRAGLIAGADRDIVELDELIGDLLLASRLEARPVATDAVDLGVIVAEEAARVGAAASGSATVRGDARALRRMVRNLLENAVSHGGAPVEATVSAGRLEVADRGPGVAESERERIWEPFYRPAGHAESEGGVGLGLALVRQIVERHGGTARWAPREGGGSRFVIEL